MELEKDKHYSFKINVHGRIMNYEGRVVDVKLPYFYLRTDEACRIEFKLKDIINSKKLPTPKKEILTICTRKKRVPREQLKKQIEPKF